MTCIEKQAYPSEAAAMKAGSSRVGPVRLFVYPCSCGYWHLTKQCNLHEVRKPPKPKPQNLTEHFFQIRTRY